MSREFVSIPLVSLEDTKTLGRDLSGALRAGDTVCLDGPIGAGKTELARAVLHAMMAKDGTMEDVPSPSFTLVQVYEFKGMDVWHVDLYRLEPGADTSELGLFENPETCLYLVEWPDRLGDDLPRDALTIRLDVDPATDVRRARFLGSAQWRDRLLARIKGGLHA
ncbi:MAG: tRNA (adenosine(37)-N6)-threonylcarbamoyltransferase complex ATPase subunit type 1 TsaE [Pseudomonadota bacterium]